MDGKLQKAVEILKQGGIAIFPTDTVFGIGCRIDDAKAVERLFNIKGRDAAKATPVLVSSVKMAQEFLEPISNEVKMKLLKKYWPGALTVILPCKTEKIPALVRGDGDTLGVRMPNHPITLALIEDVGVPIIGTSANFSGGSTPQRFEELDKALIKKVDVVLDGKCSVGKSSTVINAALTPWKVVRQGAVVIL